MTRFVLASASPRRRELLMQAGLAFEILPAQGEEVSTKEQPAKLVEDLSYNKAVEVAERCKKTTKVTQLSLSARIQSWRSEMKSWENPKITKRQRRCSPSCKELCTKYIQA